MRVAKATIPPKGPQGTKLRGKGANLIQRIWDTAPVYLLDKNRSTNVLYVEPDDWESEGLTRTSFENKLRAETNKRKSQLGFTMYLTDRLHPDDLAVAKKNI